MKNQTISIIAGPCSVDENNIREISEVAEIEVINRSGRKQKAIVGTRVVGLKSRTALSADGSGMGMDYETVTENVKLLMNGASKSDLQVPPSVEIAEKIVKTTGMLVATEVMIPEAQVPLYEGRIPEGKLLLWNPSVNQLGWQLMQMTEYADRNKWMIGIKNGKWVGDHVHKAEHHACEGQTAIEKVWLGLTRYASKANGRTILIHRGVDVPEKENYRNMPIHQTAKRVKQSSGCRLFFDPSHSYGPKMKEDICEATVEAMSMTIDDQEYLYDGILIEAGTSQTDTEQHISVDELRDMCQRIAKFRDLDDGDRTIDPDVTQDVDSVLSNA